MLGPLSPPPPRPAPPPPHGALAGPRTEPGLSPGGAIGSLTRNPHPPSPAPVQENLSRDSFLQGHIAQGPEGFVSLALVNSFNRMRRLGLSEDELAAAIAAAAQGVELDSSGTRVRPRR